MDAHVTGYRLPGVEGPCWCVACCSYAVGGAPIGSLLARMVPVMLMDATSMVAKCSTCQLAMDGRAGRATLVARDVRAQVRRSGRAPHPVTEYDQRLVEAALLQSGTAGV